MDPNQPSDATPYLGRRPAAAPHLHVREDAVVTRSERQPKPLVDTAGGVTYTGQAPLGTAEDAPGWLITKTYVVGTVTRTEYANGSMDYNMPWSARGGLSYRR